MSDISMGDPNINWKKYIKDNAIVADNFAQQKLGQGWNYAKKKHGELQGKYGQSQYWPTEDRVIKYAPRVAAGGLGLLAAIKTIQAIRRYGKKGKKRGRPSKY
jgi:hypothetical protein